MLRETRECRLLSPPRRPSWNTGNRQRIRRGAAAIVAFAYRLEAPMPITLPKLPYPLNALEPSISSHTLQEHHGSHHRAYVEKTNSLLKDTGMADWPLDEIV